MDQYCSQKHLRHAKFLMKCIFDEFGILMVESRLMLKCGKNVYMKFAFLQAPTYTIISKFLYEGNTNP